MSSGGNSTGDTAQAVDKTFFCYQCNHPVTISVSSSVDPFCPICNGGFLEEYEEREEEEEHNNPNPSLNLNHGSFLPMADPFSTLLPLLFGSSASGSSNPMDSLTSSLFGPTTQTRFTTTTQNQIQPQSEGFDPVSYLQNHLQHLRSSGTHVQFVIENYPSDQGRQRVPGNLGDYFFGPGLEQLIQQLAENDPNRYGTPPASKSAVDALPTVKVTDEMLKSDMNQCAVCMDEFEEGVDVKQMPCKHVFHQDCLLPWLELHNSCPVCRFELPTDDAEYENRSQGGQISGDRDGSVEGQLTPRSFSIQLPWPFNRQDGSGSGSGAPGSGGANLETRQEDLD